MGIRAGHGARIAIDGGAIADYCRRHHIEEMRLFGSVLREDFRPESDVDVLVRFEKGRAPGWEIVDMERELGEMLGRRVDLVVDGGLKPWWREEILSGSEIIYESP